MNFRTEIEPLRGVTPIGRSDSMFLLGSCFTSEIGTRLEADGFDVCHNPMGPLYNPASIARVMERAMKKQIYTSTDLTEHEGIFHCLDFQSKYQSDEQDRLLDELNADFLQMADRIEKADIWIITFGTARVFRIDGEMIVGNCHKLPAYRYEENLLDIDEIVSLWSPFVKNRRIIFTVSPIRHISDGLHGNQLSKSRLILAIEKLQQLGAEYFPSYEILLDDLRDYRFYAADMKHPSPTAVDYIYDIWCDTYFTPETRRIATESRRESRRNAHRQIITK